MHAPKPKSETALTLPSSRRRAGCFRRAFSLVEVLIAVAILGIMAAAAIPYFSSNVPQQMQMAADILANDLVYARGLAVANNSSYRLTFNLASSNSTYVLQHSGTNPALNKLPPSPFHTFNAARTQQTADFTKQPMLYCTVVIAAVQMSPAAPSSVTDLEFGPLGNTTRSEVTLIWLSSTATGTRLFIPITVNPITGIVDVGEVQESLPLGISP